MRFQTVKSPGEKVSRKTLQFYGLNISENFREGELSDSKGLTTDNYPIITQRKCRKNIGSYTRPTAIFAWGGLVVVDGTSLIYNGQVVGNVTEGEKQFAVVNTKLCIWPDKVFLDLNDLAVRPLEAKFNVAANSATFSTNGITISGAAPIISSDTSNTPFSSASPKYVKTYSALAWDSDLQAWVKTGEQEKLLQDVADGDLMIPAVSEAGVVTMNVKENDVWSGEENNIGIYIVVTGHSRSSTETEHAWEKFNVISSSYEYWSKSTPSTLYTESFDPDIGYAVCDTWNVNYYTGAIETSEVQNLYLWRPQVIGMTTPGGKQIVSVDRDAETYQYRQSKAVRHSGTDYSKGSKSYGLVYAAPGTYPENGKSGNYWYVDRGATGYDGTETININVCDATGANGIFSNYFSVGDRVQISGATTIPENNTADGTYLTVASVSDYTVTFNETLTAGAEAGALELLKPVPDLDYICSSKNRLWGVSNADKTIYASALGKPGDFYEYEGTDADSYAVAVGSDRDWTGIVAYGDAVLCWKENTLHKMMGDNPSEYYMATYTVNGVQDGSNLSMQVINEVLYYKGIDGIYAYTGGTPSMISSELGDHRYQYAVGGSDDLHYYVSMERQDESAWVFCVYDILRGLWIKEEERRCHSFTELDNKVLFLSDNQIWQTGQEDGETVEWMAEFCPFTENTMHRKAYSKLVFRIDLFPGSVLFIETKEDNGRWRTDYKYQVQKQMTITVPLRIGRCDKFQVRLHGTGEANIRAMERVFKVQSEV